MPDRLAAIVLALLLAAPLCLMLDLEIFGESAAPAGPPAQVSLPPLSVENLKQHAEGLLQEGAPKASEERAETLAAN